jgi:hypothetical protein
MFTSQRKNPAAVFAVAREDATAEFPLRGNSQMFTSAILSDLSTSRALGLKATGGQVADLLQSCSVKAHCGRRFLLEGSGPVEKIRSWQGNDALS